MLIDPNSKSITSIELPEKQTLDHIRRLLGSKWLGPVNLGYGVTIFVDDCGMLHIPREVAPPHNVTAGFFVVHNLSVACALCAGKGVVIMRSPRGELLALPSEVTIEVMSQIIKFVPKDQRNSAADLCKELVADCCEVKSKAHYAELMAREANIVKRAMALCCDVPVKSSCESK